MNFREMSFYDHLAIPRKEPSELFICETIFIAVNDRFEDYVFYCTDSLSEHAARYLLLTRFENGILLTEKSWDISVMELAGLIRFHERNTPKYHMLWHSQLDIAYSSDPTLRNLHKVFIPKLLPELPKTQTASNLEYLRKAVQEGRDSPIVENLSKEGEKMNNSVENVVFEYKCAGFPDIRLTLVCRDKNVCTGEMGLAMLIVDKDGVQTVIDGMYYLLTKSVLESYYNLMLTKPLHGYSAACDYVHLLNLRQDAQKVEKNQLLKKAVQEGRDSPIAEGFSPETLLKEIDEAPAPAKFRLGESVLVHLSPGARLQGVVTKVHDANTVRSLTSYEVNAYHIKLGPIVFSSVLADSLYKVEK